MRSTRLIASLIAAITFLLPATMSVAQTPFYQGKTLKVLVGYPPGGGTVWSRNR
jgi:hypothetical protein